MTNTSLKLEIDSLPKVLREEVADFVEFLKKKSQTKSKFKTREFGFAKGKIKLSSDFDEPFVICNIKTIKKSLLLLQIMLITLTFVSYSQTNTPLTFEMKTPDGWNKKTNIKILNEQSKLMLTGIQLNQYITENDSSVRLIYYSKYEKPKYLPCIEIKIYNNRFKNFDAFYTAMSKTAEHFPKDPQNPNKTTKVKIDGKDAIYTSAKFPTSSNSNPVRIKSYSIPIGEVYFQINFMDEENEDCSKLFDELIKTVILN